MGKTKDLKRRQREVAVRERRVRRQGTPRLTRASEADLQNAYDQGVERGRWEGAMEAAEEALQHSKDFKTAASIRKSIGSQVRRIKGRQPQ